MSATVGNGSASIPIGAFQIANNLSEVSNSATARINLGIGVVGETILYNRTTAPSNFVVEDGSAYNSATYASLFAALVNSAVVTMTIASPSVISWAGHTLKGNDPFFFKTSGGDTLPTGFTAGTVYYVVPASIVAGVSFQLSATAGGAAINGTGTQSGTHTGVNASFGCASDLSTFNVPNTLGEFLRMWDGGRGVDANRSFGSDQLDAMQGHYHAFDTTDQFVYVRGGGGIAGPYSGTTWDRTTLVVGSPIADSTNGTPRTAAETRPRNQVKLPCIRYQVG